MKEPFMNAASRTVTIDDVRQLLDGVIGDRRATESLLADSPLLGVLPDLDSIAMVNLIMAIEERWGLIVEDDEVERSVFETAGALQDFIARKIERD